MRVKLFKAVDVARAIISCREGINPALRHEFPTIHARVQNFSRSGWIIVRAKGASKVAAKKYSLSDMAVATILSAIQDSCVGDRSMMQEISDVLYESIAEALVDSISGEAAWILRIDFYLKGGSGKREIHFTSFEPEMKRHDPIGMIQLSASPLLAQLSPWVTIAQIESALPSLPEKSDA